MLFQLRAFPRRISSRTKVEPVEPSAKKTVTFSLTIPPDVTPTTLNCRVLKVEYKLKVYLDVKYSRDPHVSLPVVIFGAPQNKGGASASASASASAPPLEAMERAEPPPPYESLYPSMGALSLNP
ncbi:hypothetical protein ACEWY4_012175 [Coilia grayii]|uniref:Arrestin C-terminal-like domain-containing protein n=1 Tax=Coilia grayii TaxID=363190 RepID=A0ABD1JZT6_9TELE